MKKIFALSLAIMALVALPLLAQEKEMEKESMGPTPPPMPLDDDLIKWMVGEWEGWSESPFGKFQDWQKCEMAMDNQFLLIDYTSRMSSMTPEQTKSMAEEMNMSVEETEKMMADMVYRGHGTITIDPKTDDFVGYWFDNWRGMYKGTGKKEGEKIIWNWESPMGSSVRTMEKMGDDKWVETHRHEDPSGKVTEGGSVWTRKK